MKANAPEKIYVDSKAIGDDISTTVRTKRQDYSTCTEYTRTDAFIEKAAAWLEEHKEAVETEDNGIMGWIPEYFIEDFRNYMKGE